MASVSLMSIFEDFKYAFVDKLAIYIGTRKRLEDKLSSLIHWKTYIEMFE